MPAWLSQTFFMGTPHPSPPKSKVKPKDNAKGTTTRTTLKATSGSRLLTPTRPSRPPTPNLPAPTPIAFSKRRLVRKPLTISLFQPQSGSDMRPETGNAAGPAIYVAYSPRREPTSVSSHHLSFSSVLAEVGIDPEITRSVTFQEASSHSEPSGYPSPPSAVKSRGSEYVNITQGIRGWERSVPASIPIYAPTPVPAPRAVPQGPPSSLIYAPPSLSAPSPSPAASQYYARRPSVTSASGYAVAAPPTPPRTSSQSQKGLSGPVHIGSFKLLRMLEKGTFTKSYAAQDTGSRRIVCARIARKDRMLREEKIRRGLLVEKRAYSLIAEAAPRERAYLMELFGVLQDIERVVYLMVSPDLLAYSFISATNTSDRIDNVAYADNSFPPPSCSR